MEPQKRSAGSSRSSGSVVPRLLCVCHSSVQTGGKRPHVMAAYENFDVELFIDAIKNFPEIWDLASEKYHDRGKKRGAKVIKFFSGCSLQGPRKGYWRLCAKKNFGAP